MSPLELKTVEEIFKEILEGYNRRPRGWQIASDFKGNSLVLGPNVGYALKTMMIGPEENLGIGTRIDDIGWLKGAIGENAVCGLRPLEAEMAKEVFSSLSRNQSAPERERTFGKLLNIEPVPTWEVQGVNAAAVVGGPFIAHPDLRAISRKQAELDDKLRLELDSLFRSRYPMRASMYR